MWWYEEEYIVEEETGKSRRDFALIKKLFPYFKPYFKKVIVAIILLLISTIPTLTGPLIIKHSIDYEIPDKNLSGLIFTVLFYIGIQVLVIFIRYIQQVEIAMIGERAISDLKFNLFKHTISLPVAFFDKNPVGRLITRVEGDAETLKNLFSSTAIAVAQDLVLLFGMSVVMIIVNYKLYILILILLPIFLYAFLWFGKNVRPIYINLRKKIAEIKSFIMETIRGFLLFRYLTRKIIS